MSLTIKNTKKKSNCVLFIFFIMFGLLFFHRYLVEIGAPGFLRYSLDFFNLVLFMMALIKKIRIGNAEKNIIIAYAVVLIFGSLATLANIGTWEIYPVYYFFDCRNIIRFLMFFLSCTTLLTEVVIEKLFRFILLFHVVNSIFIVYQYFTLEVPIYWMRGDNLNGFFGTATGGNIYVNALLVFTTIIVLHQWSSKTCSLKKTAFFITLNLIISVLIELKAFFAEIVLIIIVFAWPYFKRITVKRMINILMMSIIGVIVLMYLIKMLYMIYPSMQDSISLSKLIESTSTSTNKYIGRLSFLGDVISLIYNGDVISAFLGVGLGTANINGNVTPFAKAYFSTHYSWYSMPYMFIETGAIGLLAYIWSFISLLLCTTKNNKYHMVAVSGVIISVFILFYDEAFKTEAGYLLYFLLALPYKKMEFQDSFITKKLLIKNKF